MITLGQYINGGDAEKVFRKTMASLLLAMSHHAVEAQPSDYEELQRSFQAFGAALEHGTRWEELPSLAERAAQMLADYKVRAGRYLAQQQSELQRMIAMLTETVISITNGSGVAAKNLGLIEQEIERAAAIEDVRTLKLKLADCLVRVREEASRQKAESEATIASLHRSIDDIQQQVLKAEAGGDVDAATGLAGPEAAEIKLREAAMRPGRKYLVTVVVTRLRSINARFGSKAGDAVLKAVRDHLLNNLSEKDQLFRWHGPTFIALVERPEPIERIRGEVRRIAETHLENIFDIGGRTVLLPVALSWSVLGLIAPADAVFRHVQSFLVAQLPEDFC